MSKNSLKNGGSKAIDRDSALLKFFNDENESVNESLKIITSISKKYNLSFKEITDLVTDKEKYLSVPVGIFRSGLSPLEAVVRYLKDILDYNHCDIARILNRDETTIWTTYKNSLKKSQKMVVDFELRDIDFGRLKIKNEEMIIPISVFSARELSILESLCLYLKETFNLNYRNIGEIVLRNERTVWTVVSRARRKLK